MMKLAAFLIGFGLCGLQTTKAQVDEDSKLYLDLMAMDSLLFVEGFNRCDLAVLNAVVSSDLEFYHDQGGYQDKRDFLRATRENICSTPNRKPIRKAVDGSIDVFPLHDNGSLYGAIQQGEHEFYIDEPGKAPSLTSIARFSHLWILDGESWQLARVYSYDHRDPPSSPGR